MLLLLSVLLDVALQLDGLSKCFFTTRLQNAFLLLNCFELIVMMTPRWTYSFLGCQHNALLSGQRLSERIHRLAHS